ncbi:MAG TPA: DUF1015 family protein [Thermoanaerobaculia bacterium]|nr:DUF1015 family protein [Thermoanaerobaculia bacterium]
MELRPFRSIRYSPATIEERGLSALIAPPGRIESPAPGNVGRLTSPADPESAGKTLGNWLAGGVLEKERRPALWVYRQTFTRGGVTLVRDALVGLVRLGAVEKGPILDPWEPPEPASVEERLSLLRVLRADFTPSFVLMRAPLSGRLATTRRPDLSAMDVGGVRHDAFRIADYGVHVELQGLVKNVEAILADGEDLFEAAIEYSKDSATAKFGGAKYKLCAIVEMDSPGLLVQPVHRLLTGFADWNPEHLIYSAADFFETREFASPEAAREALGQVSRLKAAFALVAPPAKPTLFVLRDRPAALPWPADRSAAWRELDTAALEVAFFSRLLAMDRAALARESRISYTSDSLSATAAVGRGEAQAAVLMRPITLSEIETVVHDGDRLPPGSASFSPQMFAGLFGVSLEDPVY